MIRELLILSVAIAGADAVLGWDGIQAVSESGFKCLKSHNYDFFIGRVWTSTGNYDEVGISNIKNARAAGVTDVGAYIFPCLATRCAPPANQVEATINKLKAEKAEVNYIWLDIERLAWPADHTHNRNFITAMVDEVQKMGYKPAIYSNNNNWEAIVGLDWKPFPHLPLWWANYNGEQGFSRYQEFGGWAKPLIHQYKGTTAGPCSVSMDLNYKQ
ncbi:unnamed protein product [Caenorhabditis auriculariae]|uniref:Uncharacterized protein n=1 Tax=Caenorhabditis auriculariae TaxID=2777116 RepID=A0A8S1HCU6_9PELO|nr:unnamed protein product [Caenorhabditis auriculariae]